MENTCPRVAGHYAFRRTSEAGDEGKGRGEPLAPDYERRLSRSSACNDERAELVQSNDQRGVLNPELATRPPYNAPGRLQGTGKKFQRNY